MRGIVRFVGQVAIATWAIAGCGREPFEPAKPALRQITLASTAGTGEAAILAMGDVGPAFEFTLTGTGFRPDGVYSLQVFDRESGTYRGVEEPPHRLPVFATGGAFIYGHIFDRAALFGTPWDEFRVYRHPGGDPTRLADAELVLVAPLPPP